MWSAGEQIRRRREARGLSQEHVAAHLNVTKSYLSHIENGKRPLTPDQAALLANLLRLPSDMLLIGSGKVPTDVDKAMRHNAAAVTTAVRSHTDQYAVVHPNAPLDPPAGNKKAATTRPLSSIPALIEVTKTTASYRAHSYHTKVPPAAITPFIEAFTQPGDVVLDSFCGSGMTGVAAASVGRSSILSDLSPAAVHIATNYNTFCDPGEFADAVKRVAGEVSATMDWLYRPLNGGEETIEYTVWSDTFLCPHCSGSIRFWDQRDDDRDALRCPHCLRETPKSGLTWVGEVPVETRVSQKGSRMTSHAPTNEEISLISEINGAPIPHWTPSIPFGPDREMWRASHGVMGIQNAADFYTTRNLHALAAIRHAIASELDRRLRNALMFAFTACVNRASRRYQWNEKRPTNVMTGTMYISSLRYEWNVWSLFRRKASDVLRYYQGLSRTTSTSQVFQRSATDLSPIADGSIDMAFVDPPFGSNIFYADSSLLWDAWLGSATDQTQEIVVNQKRRGAVGGKDINDYGALLTDAFKELRRVLRPAGQAVVAFSNSNDKVWTALQDAISDAGFEVRSVHILDKGQPSIKGVKGQLGEQFVTRLDLAIALDRKQAIARVNRSAAGSEFIDASIRGIGAAGEKRPDHIYASVLRDALQANLTLTGITMPDIERRRLQLLNTPSKLPTSEKAADIVAAYLAADESIPVSVQATSVSEPPSGRAVKGGRGSPFYQAHSYHTKVPPEAIAPFIRHFSKPGDVVLDPFCGSGMTGVAASLEGRRTILNDLSPAAAHLAWNHTQPIDPDALSEAFSRLEGAVRTEVDALYSAVDDRGEAATIRWTVWSTRHQCPTCRHEFALWDTIDRESGKMGRSTSCPKCLHEEDRRKFKVISNEPVWIAFSRSDGSLGERAANATDIAQATDIDMPASLWRPSQPLGNDREMYIRCALHLQGIKEVADLYTRRNLKALALIWREVLKEPDDRKRSALAFAFTNTAWHGTRMRRFNARGGHRPMTGTLYVPQLSSEANVLHVMRHKISQLRGYYEAYQPTAEPPYIKLGSATELHGVEDGSIDYVFTDPPFGSNIFYADCNLIWESWLGRVTDATLEAVINRSLGSGAGGKSLSRYGELMSDSMKEIVRVLKPGGWATVVFHNTDKDVWQAISDAATNAGLEFHEASSLDRQQQSHKGYKGRSGEENVAHFDVVMNLRKPGASPKVRKKSAATKDLASLVQSALKVPEVAARGLQGVHAEVMRTLASLGVRDFPDFSEVKKQYDGATART